MATSCPYILGMKSMGDMNQRYITKHHLKLFTDRLLPNSIEGIVGYWLVAYMRKLAYFTPLLYKIVIRTCFMFKVV